MTTAEHKKRMLPPGGFDVIAVIGRVEFNATGEMSPTHAAFDLIGRHNADGIAPATYQFPAEDGGTVNVNVEVDRDNPHPGDADYAR